MSKKNKKIKHPAVINKLLKPIIQDDRVLFTMLGALGAGVILHYLLDNKKADHLLNNITSTLKDFGQPEARVDEEETSVKENQSIKLSKTPKVKKSAKPFATEHRREENF